MTHRTTRALLALSLAVWTALSAGCAPLAAEALGLALREPAAAPASESPAAAAPLPVLQAAQAPTLPPITPGGTATSGVDVYRRVAPSLAMVETPTGGGSGLLLAGGYVLTNAHVLWPYMEARVSLPDGSAWEAAPVVAWDLHIDLALLGPLETSAPPVDLVSGEDLPVASPVYLMGYPGEVEPLPQPAIAGGMISRTREWQGMGITYFQVDATIAGGQSGGALVAEDGRVIGVSGFLFAGVYGLIASAADLAPHVERLLAASRDPQTLRAWLPRDETVARQSLRLGNLWDTQMYVLSEPPGTTVEIEVDGAGDAFVVLSDPYGEAVLTLDDYYSGPESGMVTIETVGDHFLIVGQSAEDPGRYVLRSSHPLTPYQDGLDGLAIAVGETVSGTIDYPWDMDFYLLELAAGQTVDVVVDSAMIDPYLTLDFYGARQEEVAEDDDSGGGLFGLNARLTYTAPHRGVYFVVVEDAEYEVGGYLLSVTEVEAGR